MKTALVVLSTVLSFSLSAQDIRSNNWGDSVEKVKAAEGVREWDQGVDDAGTKYIATTAKIGGLNAVLAWYFIDSKLYMVRYIFTEEHQNRNLYISDFRGIQEILDTKYGPVEMEEDWSNSLYKDDPEDYGMAVAVGHYKLWTTRGNDKTDILHLLKGDNFDINHQVMYKSKALSEAAGSKIKEKNLNDF